MQEQFSFAGFQFPRRVPRLLLSKKPGERVDRAYCAAPKPGADGAFFYLESDFMPDLRWQWADEAEKGIRNAGYYSDDDGSGDVIRGLVLRLPKARGYLAGWSMGAGMASEVESRIYENGTDAAFAADRLADSAAENARDYSRASAARLRCEELKDEIADTRVREVAQTFAIVAVRESDPGANVAPLESTRESIRAEVVKLQSELEKLESEFDGQPGFEEA